MAFQVRNEKKKKVGENYVGKTNNWVKYFY